jgi:hypothetical protein
VSATIVLGLAVLHGIFLIGPTEWAVTNKFVGWFVLLSYACSGALIVIYGGQRGRVTLLLSFAAAGAAVALFSIGSSIIGGSAERLTGFAQNANAFAFQMLLVAVCVLALAKCTPASLALLSIIFAAIGLAGSRAVLVALPFTIGAAWSMRIVSPSLLSRAIVFAGIICLAIMTAWSGLSVAFDHPAVIVTEFTKIVGASARSDTEHLKTVLEGLQLFAGSPVIGTGIGFYVEQHLGQAGEFPVIHSTTVWLLAETGLVGFFAFAAPFAWVLVSEWLRRDSNDLSAQIIVPVLVAFAITSLAHELLYQRPFWLLLGATAAATRTGRYSYSTPLRHDVVHELQTAI